jgi:hypothetical protein
MGSAGQNKRAPGRLGRVVRWVLPKHLFSSASGAKRKNAKEGAHVSVLGLHAIADQSAAPMPPRGPALHRVARLVPVPATSKTQASGADSAVLPATFNPAQLPWMPTLLVFLFAAGLTFAAVYVNALRSGTGVATPRFMRALLPHPGVGLRVEYEGEHLLITWDRRSADVRSAVLGVLRIDDGGQQRDVHLDATQVAAGSVLYKPASDDVTFRLELRSDQGAATVESLRVLNSHKSPATDAPALNAPSNRSALRTSEPVLDRTSASKARVQAVPSFLDPDALRREQAKTSGTPRVKPDSPFHAPSYVPPVSTPPSAPLTGSGAPASSPPARTPEASLGAARESVLARIPQPPEWKPAMEQTRAPVGLAPTPGHSPGLADGKTLSAFRPARAIRQVMPDTSVFGSMVVKPVQIEVRVTIDSSGRVKNARIVAGEKSKTGLAGVALLAARQWLFEPATLHGRPIESEHSLMFAFQPPSR